VTPLALPVVGQTISKLIPAFAKLPGSTPCSQPQRVCDEIYSGFRAGRRQDLREIKQVTVFFAYNRHIVSFLRKRLLGREIIEDEFYGRS
jgi:hypothetical protein